MKEWWIDADNPRIVGTGDGPTEYVAYFLDADDAKGVVELFNRVTQLEEELATWKSAHEQLDKHYHSCIQECNKLKREIERRDDGINK